MTDPTPQQPQQPQNPDPQNPQFAPPQYAAGQPIPGQPAPGQPYPNHPGAHQAFGQVEKEGKGLLAGLFDLKFVNLIGLKVIPVLYAISLVLVTITAIFYCLAVIIAGFGENITGSGTDIILGLFLGLIIGPIVWLFHVILMRVAYELFISIFQINNNTRKIADNTAK